MEFEQLLRRRKMCRSFTEQPVEPRVVDRLLDAARRAPSAGHTQGWAFVVLEGPAQTAGFWQHAADTAWLADPDHPGIPRAPVIVVPLASEAAYLARYAEPDKASRAAKTGPVPGRSASKGWPVPYWLVDTAFATMLLLLAAADEGLGALFFALHGDRAALLAHLGVPAGWEPLGAVAIGWPDPDDVPSGSARRGRRLTADVVHRGGW